VPIPRPPADLAPRFETWEADRVIVRCHPPMYHERQFNPTTHLARFRPFVHDGEIVPTMYGASDLWGALSETLFHEVPVRGANRRILRSQMDLYTWSEITPTRDLKLVQLHGVGLRALQVTHGELIETDAADYADSVPWSDALYDAPGVPDGLCWRSRQHNDSLALIMFGTRVREDDLDVVRRAESLSGGRGGDSAIEFAEAADIAIVS
jgi:hypothetical protein